MNMLGRHSVIVYKGDNVCELLFAFRSTSGKRGDYSNRKDLAPKENFVLFLVVVLKFSEGNRNNFDRIASLKVYPSLLKYAVRSIVHCLTFR